jgi:hypothetical protein
MPKREGKAVQSFIAELDSHITALEGMRAAAVAPVVAPVINPPARPAATGNAALLAQYNQLMRDGGGGRKAAAFYEQHEAALIAAAEAADTEPEPIAKGTPLFNEYQALTRIDGGDARRFMDMHRAEIEAEVAATNR